MGRPLSRGEEVVVRAFRDTWLVFRRYMGMTLRNPAWIVIGMLQPLLYAGVTPGAAAPGFNDITEGNNGAYKAGPGWDACTGLGSPDGQALLTRLSSDPPAQGGA